MTDPKVRNVKCTQDNKINFWVTLHILINLIFKNEDEIFLLVKLIQKNKLIIVNEYI